MLQITDQIALDEKEIIEEFVRAAGPGGQNVNKVATAVQLRFAVDQSPNLPEEVKMRLRTLAGKRITDTGEMLIVARTARSQAENREAAYAKLIELIQRAAIPPTIRRPTRPSRAAKAKRLDAKRHQSDRKQQRRAKWE